MMFYIDSVNFENATTVYLDALLTQVAPDGYYAYTGSYRRQVSGLLTDTLSCPSVDTISITSIGTSTATLNGNLINDGGDIDATKGFVYGTTPMPTTANNVINHSTKGIGTYSIDIMGLSSSVTYYVRAYAIVFGNIIYGDQLSFEIGVTRNMYDAGASNISIGDSCSQFISNPISLYSTCNVPAIGCVLYTHPFRNNPLLGKSFVYIDGYGNWNVNTGTGAILSFSTIQC